MTEKKEPELTFEQMYDRMDRADVPVKVTGLPTCRSEHEYLKSLEETHDQS